MVYLYATNAIKLAISLATAELEACNISPHTATSIIHMFVPACNISVNIYLSTTHMSVLACNISPHGDPSIIHLFVLMLPHSILNKGVLVITRSIQNRETNGCFLIPG
jgi:hypothetical protein